MDYVERRDRLVNWVVGILLGIVLGVAVVTAFVFLGSEDTIDAPQISGASAGKPAPGVGAGGDAEGQGRTQSPVR